MKTKILKLFFAGILCCYFTLASGQQDDRLLQLLKQELQYNMQELKKQEQPPYYMNLRVMDDYSVRITSNFGAIFSSQEVRTRFLVPQIRLGSPDLDNFKYNALGAASSRGEQMIQGVPLPLEDEFEDATREAIWRETLKRYQFACDQFEATKTKASVSVEDEDKAPCFSEAPVEKYYEAPLPTDKKTVDLKMWEKRLNEISAVFKSCPELQQGSASLSFQVYRTHFVNTEGTEIVQNRISTRVMLTASLKAADGMELPLNMDYFAYFPNDLPNNEQMIADAKDMIRRLEALRDAPVADPYTGPAILSGPASGVFFHEIFGHRLEGHRLKTGGQTFKKMVGEQVLPTDFHVYCDPTLRQYAGTDMNGHYLYDDEGVKTHRVDNVVNGVLKEFLMSRVPLDGFPNSNGHGRTSGGGDPVSRQSNLVIETDQPYSETELREMLIEEAKKQGKEYGYYFRTVTSGFTFTGEGGSLNSFNVTPLEVYRVYADGRPDQLVRGVDMIGTPLSMFSNIVAAGNQPAVFTGVCGAESGWVPVTASSPMIYVNKVETQRRAQSRALPPILPSPESTQITDTSDDDVIFKAMQDELLRNKNLALPGEAKPYYLSYTLARYRMYQINASLGGVTYSQVSPWQMNGGAQVLLGDYQHNSDIQYMGQLAPVQLPAEIDYYNIRRGFWISSDMMYRFSLEALARKTNYLQSNPLPPDLASVPDMQELPMTTKIIERKNQFEIKQTALESAITELSAIFKEYKDIYSSSVVVTGVDMNVYRLTTENVKLKIPSGMTTLLVRAATRANDGSVLQDMLMLMEEKTENLLVMEELKNKVRAFAEGLLKLKECPTVEEYYSGPVLFEDNAVADIFSRNLLQSGNLLALRTLMPSRGMLDDQLGRKIIDSRLTIKNYTNMQEYNGIPLAGHYEIDCDGVVPEKELTLVDKGIFKRQLNGRIPTLKAPASTGSARFMLLPNNPVAVTSAGTIHVKVEKGMQHEKLKKALLKAARAADLEYAYIVRNVGSAPLIYKVDVQDGKETQVRTTNLKLPDITKLAELIAVSSKENVKNYLPNGVFSSLIYPAGIIVKDVEINRTTPKIEKATVLKNPLQRER